MKLKKTQDMKKYTKCLAFTKEFYWLYNIFFSVIHFILKKRALKDIQVNLILKALYKIYNNLKNMDVIISNL